MNHEPTHVIRRQAASWTRTGTRVRLMGPITPVRPDGVIWAFCLFPDRIVRPVPAEDLEPISV